MTPRGSGNYEQRARSGARWQDEICGAVWRTDPVLKHYQDGMVEFYNEILPLQPSYTRMTATLSGEKFVDGVKSGGELKLGALEIGMTDKPEHIEYLKSFSSPEKLYALHAGKKTLSMLAAENGVAEAAAAAEAAVGPVEWTAHEPAGGRLKIAFPATPTKAEDKLSDKYPRTTWTANHPSAIYKVSATVFPQKLSFGVSQNLIQQMADSLAQNNGLTVKESTEYQIGTAASIYTMEKGDLLIKYRLYVVGDVLYELTMSTAKSDYKAENEKAFFDSFQPKG